MSWQVNVTSWQVNATSWQVSVTSQQSVSSHDNHLMTGQCLMICWYHIMTISVTSCQVCVILWHVGVMSQHLVIGQCQMAMTWHLLFVDFLVFSHPQPITVFVLMFLGRSSTLRRPGTAPCTTRPYSTESPPMERRSSWPSPPTSR